MKTIPAATTRGLCALAVSLFALFPPNTNAGGPLDEFGEFLTPYAEAFDPEALSSVEPPLDAVSAAEQREAALLERALRDGSVPIIVRIEDPAVYNDGRSYALSADTKRHALAAAQRRVLDSLPVLPMSAERNKSIKQFEQVPAFALHADAMDLHVLLGHPEVVEVLEDVAHDPALITSTDIVGASPGGDFSGYTGAGQVVAIIDTGVAKSHPFLTGKVVSEACYSTNALASGVSSLCPGGTTSSLAAGSAANCDLSLSGCNHGTHVAGIAAGKSAAFSGVARDAGIIAIQVFSRIAPDCRFHSS